MSLPRERITEIFTELSAGPSQSRSRDLVHELLVHGVELPWPERAAAPSDSDVLYDLRDAEVRLLRYLVGQS